MRVIVKFGTPVAEELDEPEETIIEQDPRELARAENHNRFWLAMIGLGTMIVWTVIGFAGYGAWHFMHR